MRKTLVWSIVLILVVTVVVALLVTTRPPDNNVVEFQPGTVNATYEVGPWVLATPWDPKVWETSPDIPWVPVSLVISGIGIGLLMRKVRR
jgi:hypothetical protein